MQKAVFTENKTRSQGNPWRRSARVVWAITAKDLLGAIKNKNTITVLITSLLMVFVYWGFPILTNRGEKPNLRIYDAGNSTLLAYLENSQTFEVWTGYRSPVHLQERLANSDVAELGLVIPAGFDQALQSGEIPTLKAYVVHWAAPEDVNELQSSVEDEIAQLLGVRVPVQLEGNEVYPTPETGGVGVNAGFSVIFVVTMTGLTLIPHLMLEEKTSHTLDALLVSPASEGQVVIAKALTGLFYCLLGAAVALTVFNRIMVHWWLAVFAVICTSLFAISLGLLLGSLIENRGQLTLVAWVFITPLFFPVFLSLMEDLVPDTLIQIFRLVPTTVLLNLLRKSYSGSFDLGPALMQLIWILAWGVAVLGLVTWLLRRRDRDSEAETSLWGRAAQRLFPNAKSGSRAGSLQQSGTSQERIRREKAAIHKPAAVQEQHTPITPPSSLGIVWAIAAKDIRSAIKNKLALGIILGTAMLLLNGPILALLLGHRDTPSAVVYDEGRSTIVRALTQAEDFNLGIVDTREELEEIVTGSPTEPLGLVIPVDFDQRAGGNQEIELQAYFAHWASPEKIDQWVEVFEQELSLATWGTVHILTHGNALYPAAKAQGQPLLNTLVIVIVIVTIGMSLVSLLIIEEKESHTFEALMVSPANLHQLVAGKALAGGFYCLVAGLVAVILTNHLFVHWGVTLIAVLLGSAFAVGLGLLVGVISDSPSTTGLWSGMVIVVLTALTILGYIGSIEWPALIEGIFQWQPGAVMINLLNISMTGEISATSLWVNMAALSVAVVLVYALTLRLISRKDR